MSRIKEQKMLMRGDWHSMSTAPKHCLIEVFCPATDRYDSTIGFVKWYEDTGFELQEMAPPVMWRHI